MKYVRLEKNIVAEIIPEFNPLFPDVPVVERYPREFVKGLIETADETTVYVGMRHTQNGGFEIVPEYTADIKTLSELKSLKLKELSGQCGKNITDGFDLNGSHYSMAITDQLNMTALYGAFSDGADSVIYHADGEPVKKFSKEEFILIYNTAQKHKNHQTIYFNLLKQYVNSLNDYETVNSTYYGQPLTGEYLESYQSMINSL